jgi:hypothetical protein
MTAWLRGHDLDLRTQSLMPGLALPTRGKGCYRVLSLIKLEPLGPRANPEQSSLWPPSRAQFDKKLSDPGELL